jgi:hypothetical protein
MPKQLFSPFHTTLESEKCPNHIKQAAAATAAAAAAGGVVDAGSLMEAGAIEASVSARHGVEGAKKAADDVMEAVEAVEQIEQPMSKDGSMAGLEEQMVKMCRPNSERFESSAHHKRKSNVHCLSWFMVLLAISDCEATTLPGYSVHSSLRLGSHSHTAAEPLALQFGNHSISQYTCQGAPTFIVGLPFCFVFGFGGIVFLIANHHRVSDWQNKGMIGNNSRLISWGCEFVLKWFILCLAVFFVVLLGFTIACVTTHKDTDIDKAFYITAFVVVLLLLVFLYIIYRQQEGGNVNDRWERLVQAGVSVFVVCTGLFVFVMVLGSNQESGVQLDQDQHTRALIAYFLYAAFLSGVWCIDWALWRRHCSSNAEAIRIKDEECGDSIPLNATGLTQVFSLVFNTFSFAGFSFAPSIPWTTASSSISFAPILAPVTQWYSNYVSVLHSLTYTNYLG